MVSTKLAWSPSSFQDHANQATSDLSKVSLLVGTGADGEGEMITRWVQTEEEQRALGLVLSSKAIFEDKNGKFWFGDETECDVCGPFDTAREACEAQREYARNL